MPMTNGYTNGHEASSPDEAGGHESNISELRHGFPTTDDELQDTYYYWTEVRPEQGNISWTPSSRPAPDWKGKEKVKTSQASLLVCLRLGYEPPDVVKTDPCAKLECWVDTQVVAKDKALEQVGQNLQRQYESLATARIRYKPQLDPKLDETRRALPALRKAAKTERVLVHYNGHGVPKPTASGEIWLFDNDYTQYIPVRLNEFLGLVEAPNIFIWDCSAAGNIVSKMEEVSRERAEEAAKPLFNKHGQPTANPGARIPWKDTLQLGACAANQTLPMNPDLPADLFTSCLTSPIEIALRFFILRNPLKAEYHLNLAFHIPGRLTDRKSPLGELFWIFTSVADTIAWNTMPQATFQRLFRGDLTVGALFRGYLLAERIMRHYECTPVSVPALPPMHNHPLWDSWDLAVDRCLAQLPAILAREKLRQERNDQGLPVPPETVFQPSRFFTDQLMAFQLWLEQGAARCAAPSLAEFTTEAPSTLPCDGTTRPHKSFPEQLPIVLQVLLSQAYRQRALHLLVTFLNLGSWAVHLALSIGTFPYVLKLLQAPSGDHKPYLIFIWTRILGVFPSCQEDLIKPQAQAPTASRQGELPFHFFVRALLPPQTPISPEELSEHRAMCCFIIAQLCRDFIHGQLACLAHPSVMPCLSLHLEDDDPLLRQWAALAISQLWNNNAQAKSRGLQENVHTRLTDMMVDEVPEVRAAVIYALSTFLGASGSADVNSPAGRSLASISPAELDVDVEVAENELGIALSILRALSDGSPMVRRQVVSLLSVVVGDHMGHMIVAAHQNSEREKARRQSADDPPRTIEESLRDAIEVGDPLSSPAFKAIIFSSIYRALCDLASDPHPSVSEIAGIVLDQIHEALFSSPLFSATDSAFAESTFPSRKSSPFSSVRGGLERPASTATNLGALQEDEHFRPPRRINSVGNALKSLAGLGFTDTQDTAPISRQRGTRSQIPSPENASPLLRQAKSVESFKHSSSDDEASIDNLYAEMIEKDEMRLDHLRTRHTAHFPLADDEESKKAGRYFDRGPLPLRSNFYDYSSRLFTEPQIKEVERSEPGSVEYNARLWRRERADNIILATQPLREEAGRHRWDEQIAFALNDSPPTRAIFHQFEDHLISSDEAGRITTFDWRRNKRIHRFSNETFSDGRAPTSKITTLKLINETDQAMLLTGSADGGIRLFRKYATPEVELVTAFRALSDLARSTRQEAGVISEWQQSRGQLLVGGNSKTIRVWDATKDACALEIPTRSNSCITSMTSDQVEGNIIVAGFGDGVVRVYDRRLNSREQMTHAYRGQHQAWIQDVHMQSGGRRELMSGSMAGEVCLWDIRRTSGPMRITQAHQGGLVGFALHDHAPVYATGSSFQVIKVWNTAGQEPISKFRNGAGYTASKNVSMTTMSFHPHHNVLAVGSADGQTNVYRSDVH